MTELESWRQRREDRLRAPTGWPSVVGLYWLKQGHNRVGSGSDADVKFPSPAPEHVGTITLEPGRKTFTPAEGVGVQVDGVEVPSALILSDMDGGPTSMSWDSMVWYLIERQRRVAVRLKDTLSTARLSFSGLEYFPIRGDRIITGIFQAYDSVRTVPVPTVLGTPTEMSAPGFVEFEYAGKTHTLEVTGEDGDAAFFVIFGDETNGQETYHGGRFLVVDAPDESGRVQIDFNRAYNPSCVFTDFATCPLPPSYNILTTRIEAGEKMYHSSGHG